jgi:thiazole synthase
MRADGAAGREAGLSNWVKLEVIGDEQTLFPDNEALIEATKILVGKSSSCCPTRPTIRSLCRKLEDAGAARVMPLGAPIGSGSAFRTEQHPIIRERPACR